MVIARVRRQPADRGFRGAHRSVTTAGDALIVRYRETRPTPDAITAQVLTFPYHMVVVPTRPGRVTFEHVEYDPAGSEKKGRRIDAPAFSV